MSNIVYEQKFNPNLWIVLLLAAGALASLGYEIWRGYQGLHFSAWVVVPGPLLGILWGLLQNRTLTYRLYQDRLVLVKKKNEIVMPLSETVSLEKKLTIPAEYREKGGFVPLLPFGVKPRYLQFKKEGHDAAVLIYPDNRLLELLERWVGKERTKHRVNKGK